MDHCWLQRGGGKLNWETIHGLFLYAVYGGRIDNDADVCVLKTYLSQYFNDDLLSGSGPSRGAPHQHFASLATHSLIQI